MENNNMAVRVVRQMMDHDPFSQWLGIRVDSVAEGRCTLRMMVRGEMLNGFGIAHGGIAFSLADSALAFASNSRNRKSLVINTSVSFTGPVREGDELTARAEELQVSNRLGNYQVTVTRQDGHQVLIFHGTVFRKDEAWFPDGE